MVVPPIISDSTKPTSVRVAASRLTRALSRLTETYADMDSEVEDSATNTARSLPVTWLVIVFGAIVHAIGFFWFFPYAAEIAAERCATAQDLGYRVGMEDWESDWQWCQMNWIDLFYSILGLPLAACFGVALSSATKIRGWTQYSIALMMGFLPFAIGCYAFLRYPTS